MRKTSFQDGGQIILGTAVEIPSDVAATKIWPLMNADNNLECASGECSAQQSS